jgi:hypothetical protein
VPEFSDYIVYVDESGDHSLQSINPEYPIFVLAFCIFKISDYTDIVAPRMQRFKFQQFGHDIVILHEHELRKSEGPFRFLMNRERREPFMSELSSIVEESPFTLIATAIRKHEFLARHAEASNPYNVAMQFGLERVQKFLKGHGQSGKETFVVFESRGKKEDVELELEFRRVCDGKNFRGERMPLNCVIASKQTNSSGLQLADLVARPIGRKLLMPEQPNRAYDILARKFDKSPKGEVNGWGLKVYP